MGGDCAYQQTVFPFQRRSLAYPTCYLSLALTTLASWQS
jgi:hypothetical protein